MYKVLIADDHPLFRDAIVNIIAGRFSDSQTFETPDMDSTIEFAKSNDDIDLILLDLNMPGMAGLNGLLELRNECPTTPVVVVSAEEEKQTILQTIAYGAVGFIAKSSSKDTIGDAIESVFGGNVYLPSDIIRSDDSSSSQSGSQSKEFKVCSETLSSLTRRQLMVLRCMTKGEANKQIAYNLNISETTVKSHVSSILKKLGVYNRVQAVVGCSDIDFNQYLKR
ncbi:response regulator transcription factor [Psychrobium sp. 1_MG-2023]|uniref:response regulator transcription factor n=1 Tax=Psychrobium sp. 1_MG-2023 TaxID=3062624 RepID=UPI000C3242B4|nr:response regulator transcription factor [Psychrobium sp. 1_MG-2023]MDP2561577.1 response regulator transcription factor [Psychrobium sp. 1_MG-2023]PKF55051.1 DNA-binding response regulator [Alteromonadales bacterium alter-6D02]